MAGVLLDLNHLAFQAQLPALDAGPLRQIRKTLQKLSKLDWAAVHRDPDLKWEAITGQAGEHSLRVSLQCRAVVLRQGDHMRILSLHFDHDGAYGRK